MIIDPKNISAAAFQAYLQGAVAPRPIAFASTIDAEGQVNLSPFSFFNVFSSNPPILVFSPSRRVRDNTTKHTLENVQEVKEVVINIVDFAMVEQMSLSSTEYDKGINEFTKAGLTEEPSEKIQPPRVKEAPVAFECLVKDIISLGDQGGAGNLIICEVILARVDDAILDADGKIDPFKLDAVARMGGDWYCRANGSALFEIPKPLRTKGIGVDQIPDQIKNSLVLTGNNLGRLGNVEALPSKFEILEYGDRPEIVEMKIRYQNDPESMVYFLHEHAKSLLEEGLVMDAWKVLLQD
ncbi:NADH-FMN oxidoreductase RutF, flavin reductase (DIM6/NTAB) family [Belliella buryatensis]|uniref:NADH-FMN oxidoreductase RutF, flavin reductase (DIM6/NTAB) family n=1 Tax=Belliella buryatensis TaxID=1500549 RepID=A0A239FE91_9BACT|nr:flavin reductase family protein [Belliella buryatensis]SNS54492.1 NADH-FMN oxidoreductase RutF, flavin reductase (DIM6/NTAB) family [Belliella buryatensis]